MSKTRAIGKSKVDLKPAASRAGADDDDLYMKMKKLESELEMLSIQEDYLRDEQRHLKSEYVRSKEEVSTYLMI